MDQRWSERVRAIPYWTDFRTASNTVVVRAVILIPLIGYWIIFNRYIAEYMRLSGFLFGIDSEATSQFPWRLFLMYFGLCLVAVASALYQWRCPSEVKLYPTATEYVRNIFPYISGIEQLRVERALRDGDAASKALHSQIEVSIGQGSEHPDAVDARREQAKRNVLQAHFDLCNRSFRRTRLVVAWCYGVGFLSLLVPSVDIFCRVMFALVRHLL